MAPDSPRTAAPDTNTTLEIDLRDPPIAALLAWLWPGAGHLYQRRTGKGLLFMICILGTYFFGLALGEGKAGYASWNQVDPRGGIAVAVRHEGCGTFAAPAGQDRWPRHGTD